MSIAVLLVDIMGCNDEHKGQASSMKKIS